MKNLTTVRTPDAALMTASLHAVSTMLNTRRAYEPLRNAEAGILLAPINAAGEYAPIAEGVQIAVVLSDLVQDDASTVKFPYPPAFFIKNCLDRAATVVADAQNVTFAFAGVFSALGVTSFSVTNPFGVHGALAHVALGGGEHGTIMWNKAGERVGAFSSMELNPDFATGATQRRTVLVEHDLNDDQFAELDPIAQLGYTYAVLEHLI